MHLTTPHNMHIRTIMKSSMFYCMGNRKDPGLSWCYVTDGTTRVNPFLMKLSILDFIMTVMCFTSYVESWVQELTRYLRTQAHIYLWFRNNYWNIALISLLGIRSYWTKIANHIIMSTMFSSSNSSECNADFFFITGSSHQPPPAMSA